MGKWQLFLVFFVSIFFLVLPNGFYHTVDRDEPKYLEAAREMMIRKDLVTPWFNCQPRFDKPVFTYWLVIAGYTLFGVNEFGGRFFISMFGVFTVLLLFLWLRKRVGETVALWAALSLLAMVDFAVMSSVAMPDVVLTFFITASLIAFFEERYLWTSLFCGFATLTKGPVGLVIPALVGFFFLLVTKDLRRISCIPWIRMAIIYLLSALPWYAVMVKIHGPAFFNQFFIFHNVKRFLYKIPGHSTQWWYYLANYPWMYLPLSPIFPFAFYKILRKSRGSLLTFAGVWFLVVFLFFQTAHTKLIHYLLPSFPPVAVVSAWFFYKRRWFRTLVVSFLAFLMVVKWTLMPYVDSLRVKPRLGMELGKLAASCKECRFAFFKYQSPELIYRSRVCIRRVDKDKLKALFEKERSVVVVTLDSKLKNLIGVKYRLLCEIKPLLEKHRIVVISNRSFDFSPFCAQNN